MAKNLIEVLTENGIILEDSSGGRKVAVCPFHEGDNDPSLTIYPTNTYWCFGCDTWGDALKFLVDYKGWSNQKAFEYLGEDYRIPRAEKAKVIKVKDTVKTYSFIFGVAEQYHQFLLKTPGAIKYLNGRGLTMDTITKYRLGYTDGHVLRLYWAWEHEIANEIGLINRAGYESMSHRITIPNLTEDENADYMVGRTVTNDKVKYLGIRAPKPIHGFYPVRHSPILFVAEGQFDYLTLSQWGLPASVLGGSHLTNANLNLLRDKRLIIIPDLDDEVGMKTANSLKRHFGDAAEILDYSELKPHGEPKLDVSTVGEWAGGEKLFKQIISEQMPWIFDNPRIVDKWIPGMKHMLSAA